MGTISRLELFENLFDSTSKRDKINSGLDEYNLPLNRLQVLHLFHRTTFSVSNKIIDKHVGRKASEIIDELFNNADKNINPLPPFFINDTLRDPNTLSGKEKEAELHKLNLHLRDYNYDLGNWWVKLMREDSESILEKLVLFWHDHFATQFAICNNIPVISMYKQNDLFRKNYAGNFRTLLELISIDGAMLRYLNGNENISESPNENFARELLELFSIGVGNYSEQDIKEAAKIFTGWKINMFFGENIPYEAYLNINQFDSNNKLFMGEIFNVNYEINHQNVFNHSIKKLIDVILSKKRKECSIFISKKLYQYFVYANPENIDNTFISTMAKFLDENNFEIKPLLKKVLKSEHFYDELNIGVQIKSPAESMIGMTKHLEYSDKFTRNIMAFLGLELFNPPNVSGWKGYRNWISTKTLPSTIQFLKEIIATNSNELVGNWARNNNENTDIDKLTERIIELFLAKPVSEERFKIYKNTLLGGAPEYEWYEITKNIELFGQRVRLLLIDLLKAPDYYLY